VGKTKGNNMYSGHTFLIVFTAKGDEENMKGSSYDNYKEYTETLQIKICR
jgi:hypothetical protein